MRGATTAILRIGRDRLRRGETNELVAAALAGYRADPDGFKRGKSAWPDAREPGPLRKPAHLANDQGLIAAIAPLQKKMEQGKRQSHSLPGFDNYPVARLRNVR